MAKLPRQTKTAWIGAILVCWLTSASPRKCWGDVPLLREIQKTREQGNWAAAEKALLSLRTAWSGREEMLLAEFLIAEAKFRQRDWARCARILEYISGEYKQPSGHLRHLLQRSRQLLVHGNAQPIVEALEDYYADHVDFPPDLGRVADRIQGGPDAIKDPWGTRYSYVPTENPAVPGIPRQQYSLTSAGPDGEQGTDDDVPYRRTFPPPDGRQRQNFERRNSWERYASEQQDGQEVRRVAVLDQAVGTQSWVTAGDVYQGGRAVVVEPQFVLFVKGSTLLIIEKR